MNQEISPVDKEQAPLAGAHNLVGISDRGRPIKALAERVAHEGARHCVVATYTHVDVSNKLTVVGDGDAPLQGTRCDALLQLTIDYGEYLAILVMR
jgi:hypothetical protein